MADDAKEAENKMAVKNGRCNVGLDCEYSSSRSSDSLRSLTISLCAKACCGFKPEQVNHG